MGANGFPRSRIVAGCALIFGSAIMAACTGPAPTPDSNLPILLTNMANPAPPKSGTGWGSNVCGGHSWLWDNGIQLTPRYEWMPVLGGEADPRIVGISGWA